MINSVIALAALISIMISKTRNVYMSLMYSIMLYINAFVLLLSLGYEFIAVLQVLVYVGALAVLFLFVIMLLEIPATELRAYFRGISSIALVGLSCAFIARQSEMNEGTTGGAPIMTFVPTTESMSNLGYALYIRYADVLLLNSLILTIALIGALVLAPGSRLSRKE